MNATELGPMPTIPMARRRRTDQPAGAPEADAPARIDRDLAVKIKFILLRREERGEKISTAQYLSPLVRKHIEAEHRAEVDAMHREQHGR
jgi:hypothetical protein